MVNLRPAWRLALALALLAAAPAPPPAPDGVVEGRFRLPERPPWAGEVFTLDFVWTVDWDRFRYLDGDLAWKADPLATEAWQRQPLMPPRREGDRNIADLVFATRALALAPGTIRLAPATQQIQIATGSYVTSGVTIATIGPVTARGAGASLAVRPLPPAPAGFGGAVGKFTLRSSFDRRSGEVGKPIVWTLTLSGTGNWAGFTGVPSRPLPIDFDVVGAPTLTPGKTDSLFERSLAESVTIVPRTAGRHDLGPVEMTIFDPVAGGYRTITAPRVNIAVAPGAAGAAPPAYDAAPPPITSEAQRLPVLRGIGAARVPMSRSTWRGLLAAPLLALLLLWAGLATQRALARDPHAAARRAHARLRRTLSALAEGGESGRRALLRAWQRDAGVRLKIDHAAPTAAMLHDPAWAQLWEEADRHLYGAAEPLPPDWPARADAALAEVGAPPRFDPRRIVAVRNLYPALLCVALVAGGFLPPAAGAVGPRPHFDSRNDPKQMPPRETRQNGVLGPRPQPPEARLFPAPGDWIGHYNRGRAAAAARQWQRAAAHAGIAWVQQPGSAATTALWTLAAREAGAGGRAAGGLPRPDEAATPLIRLTSARSWQELALLAMLLAAAGGGALLLVRFGHVPARWRRPAGVAAAIGGIGLGVGLAGVSAYGVAAAPDAAVTWRQVALRPLPVDTPDSEAKIVLAPGTAGHRGAHFLGWVRLELADGRAGWLRHQEIVPVWQPRPVRR